MIVWWFHNICSTFNICRTQSQHCCNTMKSQNAVTAYFSSKQLLPIGFSEQYRVHWPVITFSCCGDSCRCVEVLYPANTRCCANSGLMLGHSRRQWPSIVSTSCLSWNIFNTHEPRHRPPWNRIQVGDGSPDLHVDAALHLQRYQNQFF